MRRGQWGTWALATALAILGCDDGGGAYPAADGGSMADLGAGGAGGEGGEGGEAGGGGEAGEGGEGGGLLVEDPDCDPLDPAVCSFPWPSNLYLVDDPARATGVRLQVGPGTLPVNRDGVRMDGTMLTRMDGYDIAVPLMTVWPDLDLGPLPDELAIAESLADDASILWFEETDEGLVRLPYWAEPDVREGDLSRRLLFVHPAVVLKEATRYVVAFRGMQSTAGVTYAPSAAFLALREGATAGTGLEPRQARFDQVFAELEAAGIERADLQLAWDFNTASSEALHGPMLHMRREGFAAAGPDGPEITITAVEEYAPSEDGSGRAVNEHIALELRGTARMPHFMKVWGEDPFGKTGFAFNLGSDGLPAQDGWRDADFWVRIPHSALDGTPHGLVLYGHGQLGRGSQVRAGDKGQVANTHDLIFFAADLVGMSEVEEGLVPSILLDMSLFPWVGDRLHQGVLEYLLLTRAMKMRLGQVAEVMERGITIDQDRVYYSGISQGGIFGGAIMALSPDITRGHLGVPGAHYFTLLGRSRNFIPLFAFLQGGYPTAHDQWIALQVAQQIWNQTDPISYHRHISAEPFEDDAPHAVLLTPAKGDYQVSPLTVERLTRSDLGLALLPHYDDEREVPLVEPATYPHVGSGVVNWHFGNAWPPPGNQPPAGDDPAGDPHGRPRRDPAHNRQMVHFWDTGEIIDVCDGEICRGE